MKICHEPTLKVVAAVTRQFKSNGHYPVHVLRCGHALTNCTGTTLTLSMAQTAVRSCVATPCAAPSAACAWKYSCATVRRYSASLESAVDPFVSPLSFLGSGTNWITAVTLSLLVCRHISTCSASALTTGISMGSRPKRTHRCACTDESESASVHDQAS